MPIHFARKPGLVVYLTIGDPDIQTSERVAIAAIDSGADVIELGVPFSDPVADGPVIQRASERAIAKKISMREVLMVAANIRRARSSAGLIVFSYLNPVLRYGLEAFCIAAQSAGVDGALLTDLTIDEAGEYRQLMRQHKLAPIFLAAPTSGDERLKRIAEASEGFVYAISRTGITGTQRDMNSDAAALVARLRSYTTLPIAVGFGISDAGHVASIGKFADAAVVGSAIVSAIERAGAADAADVVATLVKQLHSS
jgi:tryptophan synthase alpha chain